VSKDFQKIVLGVLSLIPLNLNLVFFLWLVPTSGMAIGDNTRFLGFYTIVTLAISAIFLVHLFRAKRTGAEAHEVGGNDRSDEWTGLAILRLELCTQATMTRVRIVVG